MASQCRRAATHSCPVLIRRLPRQPPSRGWRFSMQASWRKSATPSLGDQLRNRDSTQSSLVAPSSGRAGELVSEVLGPANRTEVVTKIGRCPCAPVRSANAKSGERPPVLKQVKTFVASALGQVGYRFQFGHMVMYIDPYLSNYVEEVEGPELRQE